MDAKELPRVPPVEPAQALETFQVKKGFRLELVAAEPLVVDPIAMCFDENGRLFVVEMRDYSERRDERLGRIRLLVDSDGDGKFDKNTIFAKDLPWPTALFYYGGGLFVGSTPDVWYFKDTNGDGIADEKKLVFTGFAESGGDSIYRTNRLNVQGLFNSFNWTFDNRIHAAGGSMGGLVRASGAATNDAVDLRGKDFSFDPRDLSKIRAEVGGGQHGLSFDDTGRKFVCHNSSHIRLAMYEERYAARNPYYVMPPPLLDIPVDGPSAEVFRISPEEPWRVIRTAWRVSGKVSGPIEGGGRASGYFTSATGITIYRGHAFPEEAQGDAFIADVGSNLIHRKKLHRDGVALVAKRPADEQKMEFIASKDLWFRPVQFANAPDGTLYFADMYREVVEHPWSIPESIKKHLDLNSGNDRGRIYRIVPDNFKQPKLPQLGKATTAELVSTLANPNGWHRDTASRLLYERQDRAAIPLLTKLLVESKSPLGRLHAMYALNGLKALSAEHLLHAFADDDEVVRAHAIRLSEQLGGSASRTALLRPRLLAMANDRSARVRYQLAFSLGEINVPNKTEALAQIIRADPNDKWIRSAVLSSLPSGAGEMFAQLCTSTNLGFLRELVTIIGAQNNPADLRPVLNYFSTNTANPGLFTLAESLGSGLKRAGAKLDAYPEIVQAIGGKALRIANDPSASEKLRLEAIAFLQHLTFAETRSCLLATLKPEENLPVRLAAVRTLARFAEPNVAPTLLSQWSTYTPGLRSEVLDALIARPERATKLLEAIRDAQGIATADLTPAQIRTLRTQPNARVRELAAKALGQPSATTREEVVNSLKPALDLKGDTVRGRAIYLERCASCHRSGQDGFQVGPDLVSVKNSGKEKLLINIVDPSREVPPQYVAYSVETKEGETVVGIISAESGANVTLLQPNGKSSPLPRSSIKTLQSQKQSLMPEGLEAGLSAQQMADLLEYVLTTR